jgi:hypothetical protein
MKRNTVGLAVATAIVLAACANGGHEESAQDTTAASAVALPSGPVQHVQFNALAAAGDDSIAVFDNAVDRFTQITAARGIDRIARFTSDPTLARADRPIATADNMAAALDAERPGPGQGCLVFLTSHGGRHGLLMREDRDNNQGFDPSELGRMLDQGCGQAPTVAIVSGCFSGIFIGAVTEAPNRVILTAARDDRTSFGCGAEEQFTYFDACLFSSWGNSRTWQGLFRETDACVRAKENKLGMMHSEPQAFFGAKVANLALP